MRRTLISTLSFAILALLVGCGEPAVRTVPLSGFGGAGEVTIYAGQQSEIDALMADIEDAIGRVEAMTDLDDPESAISRFNLAAADGYYEIEDRDFYRILRLAMDYARASRGAYDPTVGPLMALYEQGGAPDDTQIAAAMEAVGWRFIAEAQEAQAFRFRRPGMALDLDGVSKGFALHVASRALARVGSQGALFVLGSNAYAWSSPPGERFWTVPVMEPRDPSQMMLTIQVENRGVAASSPSLAAGETVLDPRSGKPAETRIVAAVGVAHTSGDADAFATALAASSYGQATELIGRMRQVEVALLMQEGERRYLLASASLEQRMQLSPQLEQEIDGDVRFLLPPQEYPDDPA